jgi:hypothetical protein
LKWKYVGNSFLLGAAADGVTTFGIMAFSVMTLYSLLFRNNVYACCTECHLFKALPRVVMLNATMLNVILQITIMLVVILLRVVAPFIFLASNCKTLG